MANNVDLFLLCPITNSEFNINNKSNHMIYRFGSPSINAWMNIMKITTIQLHINTTAKHILKIYKYLIVPKNLQLIVYEAIHENIEKYEKLVKFLLKPILAGK